jgi:hypothetical protein
MKNRMRESCTFGTVRGEDSNVLAYSDRQKMECKARLWLPENLHHLQSIGFLCALCVLCASALGLT